MRAKRQIARGVISWRAYRSAYRGRSRQRRTRATMRIRTRVPAAKEPPTLMLCLRLLNRAFSLRERGRGDKRTR